METIPEAPQDRDADQVHDVQVSTLSGALTTSCFTEVKRQLYVRFNRLHPFVLVDRSSHTLVLDLMSSLSYLVRQRIHIFMRLSPENLQVIPPV